MRIALLSGYLLTFGLGFNGIAPVYASAVSDRFSGRNLGTILGLLDLGFGLAQLPQFEGVNFGKSRP